MLALSLTQGLSLKLYLSLGIRLACLFLNALASLHHGTLLQGPVGPLGAKPSCVPCFFDFWKQSSLSLHDLPWIPMGIFKQLLIRERRETREKQSRETIVQLQGKVLVPHQKVCLVAKSRPILCIPLDCGLSARLLCPWDFPGKNTGVG